VYQHGANVAIATLTGSQVNLFVTAAVLFGDNTQTSRIISTGIAFAIPYISGNNGGDDDSHLWHIQKAFAAFVLLAQTTYTLIVTFNLFIQGFQFLVVFGNSFRLSIV
jgi:hypothetical protein